MFKWGVCRSLTEVALDDLDPDGERLFVSDTYGARVLGFATLPSTNGAPAKLVLGQSTLSTSTPGTALAKLYEPQSLHTDGTTLAIADAGNVVLGQKDFTHVAPNDVPQSGKPGLAPNARTLAFPSGVTFAGTALVVNDTINRRALVFQPH